MTSTETNQIFDNPSSLNTDTTSEEESNKRKRKTKYTSLPENFNPNQLYLKPEEKEFLENPALSELDRCYKMQQIAQRQKCYKRLQKEIEHPKTIIPSDQIPHVPNEAYLQRFLNYVETKPEFDVNSIKKAIQDFDEHEYNYAKENIHTLRITMGKKFYGHLYWQVWNDTIPRYDPRTGFNQSGASYLDWVDLQKDGKLNFVQPILRALKEIYPRPSTIKRKAVEE